MEKHIVVTGNLMTGFKFYGPFDDFDAADEWAATNLEGYESDNYIYPLDTPKEN
jgi:hypothetical protein